MSCKKSLFLVCRFQESWSMVKTGNLAFWSCTWPFFMRMLHAKPKHGLHPGNKSIEILNISNILDICEDCLLFEKSYIEWKRKLSLSMCLIASIKILESCIEVNLKKKTFKVSLLVIEFCYIHLKKSSLIFFPLFPITITSTSGWAVTEVWCLFIRTALNAGHSLENSDYLVRK